MRKIETQDELEFERNDDEEGCPFCGGLIIDGLKTCENDECMELSYKLKI